MKLLGVFLFFVYLCGFAYGQDFNFDISPPTGVAVTWPGDDDLMNLSLWFNYLIFIGIVLVAIIVIGFLLEAIDCSIWCSRRCCKCCGSAVLKNYDPYSGPAYTKKKACCVALILTFIFLTIICASGVYIAFNAFFSVELKKLVETGSDLIKDVNDTMSGTVKATNDDLPGALFDAVSGLKDKTITPTRVICKSVSGITDVLMSIETSIDDIASYLPTISKDIPNEIIELLNDAGSKISYKTNTVNNIQDVNFETGPIMDSIDAAKSQISNTINTISTTQNQCETALLKIERQFSMNPDSPFMSAVQQAQNAILDLIDVFSTTLRSIGWESFSLYVYYIHIADSVRLAIELVIVAIPLLMYLIISIGICADKKFLFKVPACCTFITFWLFFVISGLHIAFWIFTKDVCLEVPKRTDTVLSIASNLTGDPMQYFGTTLSQSAKNILSCKSNFIDETCGSADNSVDVIRRTLHLESYLDTGLASVTENLNVDNIRKVDSSYGDSLSSITIDSSSITSQFTSDFAKFENSVIKIQTDAITALNDAISNLNDPSVTNDTVQTYCYTPSNNGNNVCTKYFEYTNATAQYDSVKVDFEGVRQKMTQLNTLLDSINNSLEKVIKPSRQVIVDKAMNISDEVTNLVRTINNSTDLIVNDVISQIISVFTTTLSCTYIPRTINHVDEQFCGGVVLSSLIIGVSSFAVGVLCAIGFVFILLIDKYREYRYKIDNSSKDKKKKPTKKEKNPMDLLHQIELSDKHDQVKAKNAAPLEDYSPPTYEDSKNDNFFY